MATDEVGFHVERTWFVEHLRLEVFHEHAPTEDALGTKIRVDQVMMIRVDANSSAQKHRAVGFKNFENGEELFLDGRVLELGSS